MDTYFLSPSIVVHGKSILKRSFSLFFLLLRGTQPTCVPVEHGTSKRGRTIILLPSPHPSLPQLCLFVLLQWRAIEADEKGRVFPFSFCLGPLLPISLLPWHIAAAVLLEQGALKIVHHLNG